MRWWERQKKWPKDGQKHTQTQIETRDRDQQNKRQIDRVHIHPEKLDLLVGVKFSMFVKDELLS